MYVSELLIKANQAALMAGDAIMRVYETDDFGVDYKSDNSPLTLADKAAHKVIVEHLYDTGLPILSEEGKDVPYTERKEWEYFWLVDPLDGTKEFIKRNGEFTVNIALIHQGSPIAGVIYAPYLNTLYYGSKEAGVYRVKVKDHVEEKLAPIEKRKHFDEFSGQNKVTVVASKNHLNAETEKFIDQFKNVQLHSVGSSLKLMLLVENVADIYPRLAPTMEWDIAAGHAILSALNRGVYQTNMNDELTYNKPDLLNPSFVAF